jgi:hypothetical protein
VKTYPLQFLSIPSYVVTCNNMCCAVKDGVVEVCASDVNSVVNSILPRARGIVAFRGVDPFTVAIQDIPETVTIIFEYNGVLSLVRRTPSVSINNFGYRSYEVHTEANTLRLRDNTDPSNMVDILAVDSTTGDIHYFVNVSVDNMNTVGFLGRHNLPPGFRWLNRFSSPVKVFDICFRNDGILAIRTGDPTIDGQPVVDRFGIAQDGKMFRVNMPPPEFVSPIPSPPYQPDPIGATLLYFVVELTPTSTEEASAVFDISPDNITWFNSVAKAGLGAGAPSMTQTIMIYVPSGWYVRWSLLNANIVILFKQYV